jgi:hypothetical protein
MWIVDLNPPKSPWKEGLSDWTAFEDLNPPKSPLKRGTLN